MGSHYFAFVNELLVVYIGIIALIRWYFKDSFESVGLSAFWDV